jgi:hypothetical protein
VLPFCHSVGAFRSDQGIVINGTCVGGRVFLASVGFSMNGGACWDDESWLVGGARDGDKAKVMEDGFI